MRILKKMMFLVFATLLIAACKDRVDPIVTNENNIPNGVVKYKYVYTVHVIASSENGRTEGLKNATVTVSQKANVQSVKVNESGEAVFNNLTAGDITYFVKADGFASVNNFINITPTAPEQALIDKGNDGIHELELSRSTFVTLPRLAASLKGIARFDNDQNPATPNTVASGFKVKLKYSSKIQPNLYFATVQGDGTFQFTNVPEDDASLMIDTTLTVAGQNLQFALFTASVSPSVGGTNLGTITPIASSTFVSFTGTYKFRPYADFDFLNPSPVPPNYDPTLEVPPASVIMTIDYSSDPGFPTTLNPIFTGTRDATGVWTFTKLPVGYTGDIVYSYDLTYNQGQTLCLVIPAAGFTLNASAPYTAACGAGVPVSYVKTITWNDFASGGTVNITTPNKTVDDGAVLLSHN